MVFLKALPAAAAAADRDVRIAPSKIAKLIAGGHPDLEIGMLHLETAQPPCEPRIGERMRRGDRQEGLVFLAMAGESRLDCVERSRQSRQQPRTQRSEPRASLFTDEQGRAEPLLEALHLVGDGRLGHPKLGRGTVKFSV